MFITDISRSYTAKCKLKDREQNVAELRTWILSFKAYRKKVVIASNRNKSARIFC